MYMQKFKYYNGRIDEVYVYLKWSLFCPLCDSSTHCILTPVTIVEKVRCFYISIPQIFYLPVVLRYSYVTVQI